MKDLFGLKLSKLRVELLKMNIKTLKEIKELNKKINFNIEEMKQAVRLLERIKVLEEIQKFIDEG